MKKLLIITASLLVLMTCSLTFMLSNQDNTLDNSSLAFILQNASADDEYTVGPPLTNWKSYTIQCTYTKQVCVGGGPVPASSCYTTSYTAWVSACGSGSGWCMSPAGC